MQQKTRKTPERMCLGCREMKPKKELMRVVREPADEGCKPNVSLDFRGKKPGRGAYVCRSADCLKKAVKSRALQRSLETEIPDEIIAGMYAELEKEADGA